MAEERLQITIDEKGALVVKRRLEDVGKGAQKAGGGVKLLRTALGGLAAVGVTAALTKSVKTMASFGQEMSTVAAVTKATSTQLETMTAAARELGATTRFSATQAAEGMTFLARAGFSTEQVLASIGPTLNLAQAGALDLGRAADIASNVLTGFRLEATEAARAIDVLANAANSANTDVNQLGEALSFVAPVAASLKVPLEETAAAVQSLSDAGIQASRAGTNLTTVMRLMTAITPNQAAVLDQLGLSTEDVSIANVGLTQALQNLDNAGITTTQTFKFFGRSAAAAGVLLDASKGKLEAFTESNENAGGTAKEVAAIMDNNLNGALLAVRSAYEELQLAFGAAGPEAGLTMTFKAMATALREVAANIELTGKLLVTFGVAVAAIKFAPMLQSLSASVTQFIALRQAAAAGTAVILGSAQADAAKAASALVVAQAEAKLTAATLAATSAKRANMLATNNLTVSSQFRINTINQATAAELRHATSLKAVGVAQARSTIATKAAAGGMLNLSTVLAKVRVGMAALALNPITIGLVVLAAAVTAVTLAFDKFKKLQEEIERIEEATHQMRLKRVQAQVREIKERKAATAAVEAYIKGLEQENRFAGFTLEKQAEQVNLLKAMELAKRDLTDAEKETITNLLKEKIAIKQANDVRKQENELLQEIKEPQAAYTHQLALLNSLQAKNKITAEEYDDTLAGLKDQYGQLASGLDGYLAKLTQENELLKLNAGEQEIQRALLAARAEAGQDLTDTQIAAVKALVAERQALSTTSYLDQLAEENRLLSLNNKEQELQKTLAAARSEAGGTLSAEQEAMVVALFAEKQALVETNNEREAYNQLLMEIKGPQLDYEDSVRRLNVLLTEGTINQQEFDAQLMLLKGSLGEISLEAQATGAIIDSMWQNASSTLDAFVDGGIITFRGFTSALLGDISKILAKMLLLKAIRGIGGGLDIGGAANGASFMVGGSGGTDSQLVTFKATPNERVDVLTPAQQQQQAAGAPAAGGGVNVTVINLIDPEDIPAAMASAAGDEVILNSISLNKTSVKAAVS